MAAVELQPFRGWPAEAFDWFRGLEADNSRAWFQANRPTYDRAVRGPLESLLAEVEGEFGEGKAARPNRDTRFAADKSPYKLQAYARVPRADGGGSWYVQLRLEGLFAGGGVYAPDRERLGAIRAAIADDDAGAELERIVARLRDDGLDLLTDGSLKTAPRGYRADHPRIALLRLPHLAAGVMHEPAPWLHTAEAKRRIVAAWRSVTPLLDWAAKAQAAAPPAR
jgi:uncharacterized protein (TIGR02453 family)